jgi:hypothetical protein
MEYKIEEIGCVFSRKAINSLEQHFTARGNEEFKFHSVIPITKTGCLGFSKSTTYLAVFVKE